MTSLNFTLSPEAIGKFYDALTCLSRFSEDVSIEARRQKFILTALNSAKSTYAAFTFDGNRFFRRYQFRSSKSPDHFSCRIYNKTLLSIFKGRIADGRDREKESAIDRCELSINDDPERTECRLIVKMVCRNGVLKTYKLTYESVDVLSAVFDKESALNRWTISSRTLREFIEYFGPKTEQLDISSENGRATFMSYTEKVVDGKEILKQPLQTSVAIDVLDFSFFEVEDKLHIAISVKDFKSIVIHAETLNTDITAYYSRPNRPMQIAYQSEGLTCEFTLMTIGDYRGVSATPAPVLTKSNIARTSNVVPSISKPMKERDVGKTDMPPPQRSLTQSFTESGRPKIRKPSPPPPQASMDSRSLFLPEDDDRQWDERTYEEDEDQLGWDASADNDAMATRFGQSLLDRKPSGRSDPELQRPGEQRLEPTQRLSEVQDLFGD